MLDFNESKPVPRYGEIWQRLEDNGYQPIPIQPGTKQPTHGNWNDYNALTDALKQQRADFYTGQLAAETTGVDIDVYQAEIAEIVHEEIVTMIGARPPVRTGQAPKRLLMCRANELFKKKKTREFLLLGQPDDAKSSAVEILADGQQFLIYAVHPDTGRPYDWSGGDPLNTAINCLPPITEELAERVITRCDEILFEEIVTKRGGREAPMIARVLGEQDADGAHESSTLGLETHPQIVVDALQFVPVDLGYDDWITICAAVKRAVGPDYQDYGRQAFVEWSRRSPHHGKSGATDTPEKTWDGIKLDSPGDQTRTRKAGAGTIIAVARANGWEPWYDIIVEHMKWMLTGAWGLDVRVGQAEPAEEEAQAGDEDAKSEQAESDKTEEQEQQDQANDDKPFTVSDADWQQVSIRAVRRLSLEDIASLRDTLAPERWKPGIMVLVAALVFRRLNNDAIKATLANACPGGFNDTNLEIVLDSARAYLEVPNAPEAKPLFEQPSPVGFEKTFGTMPKPPEILVDGLLPCDVAGFAAPGGTFKTTIMLYVMIHIALERETVLGRRIYRHGPCLLVTAEDEDEVVRYRIRRISDALGLSDDERRKVAKMIHIEDVCGEMCRLVQADNSGNLELTRHVDDLIHTYQSEGLALNAFDPMTFFGPGERFVNDGEAAMMQAGRRVSRGLGGSCNLFSHHTGQFVAREKITDQYAGRGGSAFGDNARAILVAHTHGEGDGQQLPIPEGIAPQDVAEGRVVRLHIAKFNYGKRDPRPIWIVRDTTDGFKFTHFEGIATDPASKETAERELEKRRRRSLMSQVWHHVRNENDAGRKPTRRSIRDNLVANFEGKKVGEKFVEAATCRAIELGHLIEVDLPKGQQQGRKTSYLIPGKHPAGDTNGDTVNDEKEAV